MAFRPILRYCTAMIPPSPTRTLLTPARLALLAQFFRFGVVGFAGFLVDTAAVYAFKDSLGLIPAGLLAYLAAATTTWAGNRAWTFAGPQPGSAFRQWLLFLAANGLGFVLNRGTFTLLVLLVPLCADYPVLAVLAGVAAGLGANFHLSRKVVFGTAR
ncbi:MAG: GtrA family protein [Janthinobacterium lividum]